MKREMFWYFNRQVNTSESQLWSKYKFVYQVKQKKITKSKFDRREKENKNTKKAMFLKSIILDFVFNLQAWKQCTNIFFTYFLLTIYQIK